MSKIFILKNWLAGVSKKLIYLLVSALTDFSDFLLLFIFPIIIFEKLRTFWLSAAIMVLWPLSRGFAHILIKKVFHRNDSWFQYLFGFTLIFVMVIIINRAFTVFTLPVLIILWGLGLESVRMSILGIRNRHFNEYIGSWSFLYKPVQAFAVLLAPIFAMAMYSSMELVSIFNFFGFAMSVTALLFFFGMNKKEPAVIQATETPGVSEAAPGFSQINKSVLFVNLLAGIIWLQLPLQIINNSKTAPLWFNVMPLYLVPFFLLAIFKNVINVRIWQLQSRIKVVGLGVILLLGFFAGDVLVLSVLLCLTGIVSAFILLADAHERQANELDAKYVFSMLLGLLLASILTLVLGSFITTQIQLGILGVAALIYGVVNFVTTKLQLGKVTV